MSEEVYLKMNRVFDNLPLAAVIDSEIFCCHGGIGPHLNTIQQILDIERPLRGTNFKSFVSDLLWADPGHLE